MMSQLNAIHTAFGGLTYFMCLKQILAVKNINTVSLSINEEEQFMEVIRVASRMRHPNIVALVGYCVQNGQHLIVYEFIRNFSLDDALHSIAYKPLSWGTRLQIALGVARALKYVMNQFLFHFNFVFIFAEFIWCFSICWNLVLLFSAYYGIHSYMHSFVPPVAHSNLKAVNILLDEELRPHICDYGLAILRSLSSNSVKLKVTQLLDTS